MSVFTRISTLIGLAVLTIALGVLAMVAPVKADDPVVNWPQAGQAPSNTVLPLSPYRPLNLNATVPCTTLQSVDPTNGTALRTQPEPGLSARDRIANERTDQGLDAPRQPEQGQRKDPHKHPGIRDGLRVGMNNGHVRVTVSNHDLINEPLPTENCSYRIVAEPSGVKVYRDGAQLAGQNGLLPPQVAELSTEAAGTPAANGLAVTLHTDARYQTGPSALKLVLLIAHALALAGTLVLAWRRWRGDGTRHRLVRPGWSIADAAAIVVTAAWVVLGPMQMDDSWYLLMARNASSSGFIGNYIYMFNGTESPFVLSQYLMQAWGELGGWSLWWMRLVPAACGLVTWFVLRLVMATLLGRAARLRVVPWALLVAHLLWYLPYGASLRPEPVVVVFAAVTLLFAELARVRESVGTLAAATASAGLAVAVSPSGVVAAAPLVLSLPWLGRWLLAQSWPARSCAVVVAGAAATIFVPFGFADASLGEVLDISATHQQYYTTLPWYEELAHYRTLLDTSGWARRMPVLLTVVLLVVVAIGSGRGGLGTDPVRRLTLSSAVTSAVALGLIALSPTKWVNHFHAIAAVSTILIAGTLVRSPLPRRAGVIIRGAAILLTVTAVSLAFAGNNNWHPFSDAGQLFGDHASLNNDTNGLQPHIGPIELRDPLPWIAVALAVFAWARWRRRQHKLSRIDGERAVLATASFGSVALLLVAFVWAPISQGSSWTIARSGLQTLFGDGCGIADDVQVLRPSTERLGQPSTQPLLRGDFVNQRPMPLRAQPWQQPTAVWHDDQPDGTSQGTGTLVTGWYPVPPHAGTHVSLPVAGKTNGQVIKAQFGQGDPAAPAITGSQDLHTDPRPPTESWQQASVELSPDQRPAAVRFVISDVVTGKDSWLAAAEPKLTERRSVVELTQGHTAFADQVSAGVWPCVRQAQIKNGITETPSVYLGADEAIEQSVLNNPTFRPWGGAWVQTARTWVRTKLDSELQPKPPPRLAWGQVFTVRYPYPPGQYDLTVNETSRGGLTQLPSLGSSNYLGTSEDSDG